jgi:aminoglycoside 6'-N-acetyltransferase
VELEGSGVTLTSPRLLLRPAIDSDLDALVQILSEPEVAPWWPDFNRDRVHAELLTPEPDLTVCVIEQEGRVLGAIQFAEEADPMYRHASIDLFLGSSAWGQGLGPEAIRALTAHLIQTRGHHRIVIDPAVENTRAIAAYQKVGFRRVGVMRRYERGSDGSWHDGLLMELLAEDFAP